MSREQRQLWLLRDGVGGTRRPRRLAAVQSKTSRESVLSSTLINDDIQQSPAHGLVLEAVSGGGIDTPSWCPLLN